MKIIGGQFKNRNFYIPAGIRPTQHIVRKALFDLLGQDLSGQTFLELFAGSGSVGLEALSRGAKMVTFVEKDPKSLEVLYTNLNLFPIDHTANGGHFEVIEADAFATIKQLMEDEKQFDIIFLDPPYREGLVKKALNLLGGYDKLQPNCCIVVQHDRKEIAPEKQGRFSLFRQKKYGLSYLSFYGCEESDQLDPKVP